MSGKCQSGPPGADRQGAFTLIEIIVAMTIIAVITAVAVPTLKGLNSEEKLREPLTNLAAMVQEVRLHAMKERRPYEIILEKEGLHAIPGNRSFAKRDEFLKHLEELRTPPLITSFERETIVKQEVVKSEPSPTAGSNAPTAKPDVPTAPAPPKPPEIPWTLSIRMSDGMECEVLMWGDGEWEVLEGDRLRRWVFLPNGMADPAQVRFVRGGMELEADFDLLTGEMTTERSRPRAALR